MKHNFMNKENGKIASVLVMYLDDEGHMQTDGYDKVEDLMEDYAAYKPAEPEPLIKDEKIRNAVRAWAEANEIPSSGHATSYGTKGDWLGLRYSYSDKDWVVKLEIDSPKVNIGQGVYTIAELCGEEEE